MTANARIAVVGATGYVGYELVRLLVRHPGVAASTIFLRNGQAGARSLAELFPQLRGMGDAACAPFSVQAVGASGAELVFLATPADVSLELAPPLLQAGLRVVDLSGAFRFRDPETFSQWYGLPAAPEPLLSQAVYGLPETMGPHALREARLVANPGCYATSVILALWPLLTDKTRPLVDTSRGIVCDCKSGASGAGKQPTRELHFVEVDENLRAYSLFTHRHTPEIFQQLGLRPDALTFTTHLLPVARGILSTIYVWLREPATLDAVASLYLAAYAGQPLVRICSGGALPELHHVAYTNFCDIGFALDPAGRRLIVVSCLDNLGKGAAGEAIQNMNQMLGFEPTAGLL